MQWEAPEPVVRAVFSPSGKYLATTCCSNDDVNGDVLRLWDTNTGKEVARLDDLSQVFSLAFTGERGLLVVEHQRCLLWNGHEPRVLRSSGHWTSGTASPSGKFIAIATEDGLEGAIEVLNLSSGTVRHKFALPTHSSVWYDEIAAVGPFLAGICRNSAAILWNAKTGHRLRTYDARSEVWPIAIHPAGRGVAVGDHRAIYAFGLEHEDPLDGFKPFKISGTHFLTHSPDGESLLALGDDGFVQFSATTGKQQAAWDVPKESGWADRGAGRTTATIDPARERVALAIDRTITIWNYGAGKAKPKGKSKR